MREMNNANTTEANGNVYANTCTLINTSNTKANNNKHEENTWMRMRIYKRSQKISLEGKNKNLPSRECSLD